MFDYESPITQILGEIQMEYENGVLRAVQNVGFHVNKEELAKALAYDRGQYDKGYEDGLNADKWIPCEVELPPKPKVNPFFEYKPLELYLVTVEGAYYPFRAFWNGKEFTDGWSKVDVIAWQPLPAPYQKGE